MWAIARQLVVALVGGLIDKWMEHRQRKQAEQDRLSLAAERAHEEGRQRAEIAERDINAAADEVRGAPADPFRW